MESRMIIDEYGTKRWYNENDQLHREDGPAVIESDGSEIWYQNGKVHRDDDPAIILPDGTKEWLQNGKFHREDGPAVIESNGKVRWWLNDKQYRFREWANELNLDQKARLEMVMVWDIS